jgi:hypothetical protein
MSLLILGIVVVFVVVHLESQEEALHREERLVQTRLTTCTVINRERSEQSVPKGERPGETNTNFTFANSIRKIINRRMSLPSPGLFLQELVAA